MRAFEGQHAWVTLGAAAMVDMITSARVPGNVINFGGDHPGPAWIAVLP